MWMNHEMKIITARQRCCGKVMFSQVSVCLSVHTGVLVWPLPMMHWTLLYRPSAADMGAPIPALCRWHLVAVTGNLFKCVHCTSLYRLPPWYWHLMVTEASTVGILIFSCFMSTPLFNRPKERVFTEYYFVHYISRFFLHKIFSRFRH